MKSLPCPLLRLAGGRLMPVVACLPSPALAAATAPRHVELRITAAITQRAH